MVTQARIETALDDLNGLLGEITPYKLTVVDPAEVQILRGDENARYMPKKVYDRLVANIAQDTNLSSLPFLWRTAEGVFICLSGNHRVMAARDAGIPLILALYTDDDLSRGQQVAIQLSHNALAGKDDPTILRQLWREMEQLEWKSYSGLDDELLASFEPVTVDLINEARLRFEELRLLFLPPEIETIKAVLEELGKHPALVARYEDFDAFFETLLDLKEQADVLNTATAFRYMIDIVRAWLDENAEQNEGER
jgi:hypothetical protein